MYIAILIIPKNTDVFSISENLSKIGRISESGEGRFLVERDVKEKSGDWIAVSRAQEIENDYAPEALIEIRENIGESNFYLIEISSGSVKFSNDFILNIDESMGAFIDNNHGCTADIRFMRDLILRGIDWRYYSGQA